MEWKDLENFDLEILESDKVHKIDEFVIYKNSKNKMISISKMVDN